MTEELFHSFLSFAVKRNASDIHFEVNYPPTYRILGELVAARHAPLTHADTEAIAGYLLAGAAPMLPLQQGREVDRSYSLAGVSRFRASIFKQRGSWGAVLRTIPFAVPDLDALGLPPVVHTVAEARRGLVLVTGASGNGKSTTIAAIVERIVQRQRVHVITVEDPIEFLFPPGRGIVIQREVGSDTRSYSDALRAALRQDPNVLVVSELRDRESADVCLRAAEMGHLVIASLNTQDVLGSIERLLGLFAPDEQAAVRARLADHLQAVLCLRLVLRADSTGLVPAVEALLATAAVRDAIRDGGPRLRDLEPYMAAADAELGMQPLDHHLERMWADGRISYETALANARNRAELERRLAARGGHPA